MSIERLRYLSVICANSNGMIRQQSTVLWTGKSSRAAEEWSVGGEEGLRVVFSITAQTGGGQQTTKEGRTGRPFRPRVPESFCSADS